jgi:hypothetical protein
MGRCHANLCLFFMDLQVIHRVGLIPQADFVHPAAPLSGLPLPPTPHERKIQSHSDALGSEPARQLRIPV